MAEKKKSGIKYVSIIPKPGHTLSAYQLYTKTKWNDFPEHIPSTQKISKLSEMWKLLSNDELEMYKERAEILKKENKKEWNKKFEEREQLRRDWCEKLGISNLASWEEIDMINRRQWERRNGIVEVPKEKKNTKKKTKSKDHSDEETSSSEEEEMDGPSKRKLEKKSTDGRNEKKRRVAIDHALLKMKESVRDELDDSSDSNASDGQQKKKKTHKAHQASSGSSSGMLSGSFLSNGTSRNDSTGEGKKLKKRTSRLGDVEWAAAMLGEERVKAVLKGIDKVYEMALDQDNFDIFGNDMIQCFYDVATVTGEPVRSKTLKYVEHLANRWKYTVMQDGWKQEDELPTPCEVIEVVTGMYCMERVGIRHDLKAEVLEFLQSSDAYTAKDYFGWDPQNEPLREEGGLEVISDCHVSKYRLMSSSLIHSFYSDRVGLRLGCDYADIFKWLPLLRPYKGPHQLPWQEYIDQCYLITHIIFTTNNWGELSLEPALFPHEYFFLRNHLDIHIQQRDVHLIAEFVESLRCFGCTDDDPLIRKGIRTLLELQTENGIWDPTDDEPYRTYHATMCAVQALLAHRFRGFGPGIPSVLPLLVQWSNEVIEKSEDYRLLAKECNTQILAKAEIIIKQRELEYGPIISGDIATEGSVMKPRDMAAHSAERMNTLKLAMRSFAKATSHLFVEKTPSVIEFTSSETIKKIDDDSGIDEINGNLLDELFKTIGKYLQSVGLTDTSASASGSTSGGKNIKSFTTEEIQHFVQLLSKSADVPVTATILQSNRYKNLTKNIRQLSKGKGKDGIAIDPTVQVASSKLMTIWKNKVMASSNLGNETGDLNSPRASVPSEKFESKKSSDEEEVAIPSPNDLSLHKEESNDHKIIISSENIHESNPFNSELSDKMIPNTNPSIVIQENTTTTTTPAENYSTNMDIVE